MIERKHPLFVGRSGRRSASCSCAHKSPIVSMCTISPAESKSLHLVAVTSDGRRMYLSTSTSVGNNRELSLFQQPSNAQKAGDIETYNELAGSANWTWCWASQ